MLVFYKYFYNIFIANEIFNFFVVICLTLIRLGFLKVVFSGGEGGAQFHTHTPFPFKFLLFYLENISQLSKWEHPQTDTIEKTINKFLIITEYEQSNI